MESLKIDFTQDSPFRPFAVFEFSPPRSPPEVAFIFQVFLFMSTGEQPSTTTQPDPKTAPPAAGEVKPEPKADSKEEGVSKSEEPKKPASVSLRPGGGDASFSYLSLRPGGGSLRPGGGTEGFSFRPGGGMNTGGLSSFSSDSNRRSGSSKSQGGHHQGRGRGGYGAQSGSPVRYNRPSTSSSGPKRDRKVYTRETILSLKSKCKGMPTQGTMDRIPGVYKVSDEEWRAAHNTPSASGSPNVTSSQQKGEKWVPPSMRDGLNFTIDQEELRKKRFEETVRHMNGLLNKATPENYETVAPAVKASFEGSARDGELLEKHWSLIFEKALSEPNYAFMWGNLCVQLSGGDAKAAVPGDSIYKKFRAAVLNMSQLEFERMQKEFKIPEKDFDKDLYAKKEAGTFTDDDVSELEERRVKRKKRRLGTINFIGELFKKGLLRKELLYLCFGQLLSQKLSDLPIEERCHNIEAFCILVTVVGSSLEIGNPRVVPHFQRLESILQNDNQLPPRIRFKIEDVIESRQAGWTKVVGNAPQPMKIGMVHANAVKKSAGAGSTTPEVSPAKPEKVVPTRSEEELESLCNNLLEEYLASYDANEAVICVTEMDAPYYHAKFVLFLLFSLSFPSLFPLFPFLPFLLFSSFLSSLFTFPS